MGKTFEIRIKITNEYLDKMEADVKATEAKDAESAMECIARICSISMVKEMAKEKEYAEIDLENIKEEAEKRLFDRTFVNATALVIASIKKEKENTDQDKK